MTTTLDTNESRLDPRGWAALLSPPHLKSLPAWTPWRDELAEADARVRQRMRFLFTPLRAPMLSAAGARAGLGPDGVTGAERPQTDGVDTRPDPRLDRPIASRLPDDIGEAAQVAEAQRMGVHVPVEAPQLSANGKNAGLGAFGPSSSSPKAVSAASMNELAMARSKVSMAAAKATAMVSRRVAPISDASARVGITGKGPIRARDRGFEMRVPNGPVAQDRERWKSGTQDRISAASKGLNLANMDWGDHRGAPPKPQPKRTWVGKQGDATENPNDRAACAELAVAPHSAVNKTAPFRELEKERVPSDVCPEIEPTRGLATIGLSSGIGKNCACDDCPCDEEMLPAGATAGRAGANVTSSSVRASGRTRSANLPAGKRPSSFDSLTARPFPSPGNVVVRGQLPTSVGGRRFVAGASRLAGVGNLGGFEGVTGRSLRQPTRLSVSRNKPVLDVSGEALLPGTSFEGPPRLVNRRLLLRIVHAAIDNPQETDPFVILDMAMEGLDPIRDLRIPPHVPVDQAFRGVVPDDDLLRAIIAVARRKGNEYRNAAEIILELAKQEPLHVEPALLELIIKFSHERELDPESAFHFLDPNKHFGELSRPLNPADVWDRAWRERLKMGGSLPTPPDIDLFLAIWDHATRSFHPDPETALARAHDGMPRPDPSVTAVWPPPRNIPPEALPWFLGVVLLEFGVPPAPGESAINLLAQLVSVPISSSVRNAAWAELLMIHAARAAAQADAQAIRAAGPQDVMRAGDSLALGEFRVSKNLGALLVFQGDGNLVLYDVRDLPVRPANPVLWTAGTGPGRGANRVVMQTDGNLVVYAQGAALWASDTSGHPGSHLAVQDDGNVVIYGPYADLGITAYWSTETNGFKRYQPWEFSLWDLPPFAGVAFAWEEFKNLLRKTYGRVLGPAFLPRPSGGGAGDVGFWGGWGPIGFSIGGGWPNLEALRFPWERTPSTQQGVYVQVQGPDGKWQTIFVPDSGGSRGSGGSFYGPVGSAPTRPGGLGGIASTGGGTYPTGPSSSHPPVGGEPKAPPGGYFGQYTDPRVPYTTTVTGPGLPPGASFPSSPAPSAPQPFPPPTTAAPSPTWPSGWPGPGYFATPTLPGGSRSSSPTPGTGAAPSVTQPIEQQPMPPAGDPFGGGRVDPNNPWGGTWTDAGSYERARAKAEQLGLPPLLGASDAVSARSLGRDARGREVVLFIYSDGRTEKRIGGSHTWRTHNPGAMILGPKHVPGTPNPPRPIGNDGLAIFASDRAGWDAAKYQLQYGKVPRTGGFYHDLSIQDAIKEWAPRNVANDPANQNDPKAYAAKIRQLTGLDPTRLIKNLSPAELNAVVLALQTIEIWEAGSCEPAPCREFLM